jgi:hypothetical protein
MNPLEQAIAEANATYEKMGAQQDNCGQVAGLGNMCCKKQETTRERLQRRLRNSNDEHVRLNRVLDILERHPEFEEFLEVLRSGLV